MASESNNKSFAWWDHVHLRSPIHTFKSIKHTLVSEFWTTYLGEELLGGDGRW